MIKSLCEFRRAALTLALVFAVAACGSNDPSTFLASAKSYIAKSEYKAAIVQLKNAAEGAPTHPEVRFLLAKALLETQDPVGAETEARKAIEFKFTGEEVVPLLARAMLAQGKLEPLIREFGNVKLETTQGRGDLGTTGIANDRIDIVGQAIAIGVRRFRRI